MAATQLSSFLLESRAKTLPLSFCKTWVRLASPYLHYGAVADSGGFLGVRGTPLYNVFVA